MAMPGSYSCFIPLILNQMCIITVLGVVSTCLTVHLVGCARAGFAGEVPCVEGCWLPDLVLAQWLSPPAHRESWEGESGFLLGHLSCVTAFFYIGKTVSGACIQSLTLRLEVLGDEDQ